MLAKSTKLNKNVFEMNNHYLELQTFLSEVEKHPEIALDPSVKAFPSEDQLYGDDREHASYGLIEEVIFLILIIFFSLFASK